ncbi:MAG: hypothetical protein GXO50_08645 [Chlorobi bacterium]|nr:hypothetical protein [Chlorobiota bacterium]
MDNLKRFEKWYSKHVTENHKAKVSVNIRNLPDYAWCVKIDLSGTDYECNEGVNEKRRISDYNYYEIKAEGKVFEAEGDFTKLDFITGKFLSYIGETELYSPESDYFLNPDIQDFIFGGSDKDFIFLHYTQEESFARNIIEKGFMFTVFDKTTGKVRNDLVDLNYNHIIRKPFGRYVVVIRIAESVYKKYLDLSDEDMSQPLKAEEFLTLPDISENESGEKVYTLHPKFVKGYFDYKTGKYYANPEFDSSYDSDEFMKKNIK